MRTVTLWDAPRFIIRQLVGPLRVVGWKFHAAFEHKRREAVVHHQHELPDRVELLFDLLLVGPGQQIDHVVVGIDPISLADGDVDQLVHYFVDGHGFMLVLCRARRKTKLERGAVSRTVTRRHCPKELPFPLARLRCKLSEHKRGLILERMRSGDCRPAIGILFSERGPQEDYEPV